MTATTLTAYTESLRQRIDRELLASIPQEPVTLYDPVRATLSAGGKRVRPILTALVAELSTDGDEWLGPAIAVELLHTFTLVHDDIMDNAASRRGKPTTHIAYGTNAAILSGDVLIALAIESISRSSHPNVAVMIEEFGLAFRLVCEGQALDKDFELRDDITVPEYLHMIDLKTSKVLELAAVLGALAGTGDHIEDIRSFAHHLGLAFQISDDLLDLTAKEADFGKTIGGDILEGKRTLLFVAASRHTAELPATDRALMDRIRDRRATPQDIPHARDLFAHLGILDEAAKMATDQTRLANEALSRIQASQARDRLREFSGYLLKRIS